MRFSWPSVCVVVVELSQPSSDYIIKELENQTPWNPENWKKLVLFVFVLLLNGQDERLILHLMCWSLGECQNIGVNPLEHQSQGHETHEYPLSCHQHLKIFNIYFVIPVFSQ